MKSIITLFVLLTQFCMAQTQQLKIIDSNDIVGVWGKAASFKSFQSINLSKDLGAVKDKTSESHSSSLMIDHLVIDPMGNFSYAHYTNAKWKIVDQYLVVTIDYGKEMKGFLSADTITNAYRLTFDGHVFTREKKFVIK